MIKRVVLAIVSLAILVLVFGAMLPSQMHVERTTEIIAMPDQVFDHVNDLRAWEAWSPWYRMDPEAHYVYSEPSFGEGASLVWDGKKIYRGGQVIRTSDRPQKIEIAFDFGPDGGAVSKWIFRPNERGTRVAWEIDIDRGNNPLAKLWGVMRDRELGDNYEQGLKKLKQVCEIGASGPGNL